MKEGNISYNHSVAITLLWWFFTIVLLAKTTVFNLGGPGSIFAILVDGNKGITVWSLSILYMHYKVWDMIIGLTIKYMIYTQTWACMGDGGCISNMYFLYFTQKIHLDNIWYTIVYQKCWVSQQRCHQCALAVHTIINGGHRKNGCHLEILFGIMVLSKEQSLRSMCANFGERFICNFHLICSTIKKPNLQ